MLAPLLAPFEMLYSGIVRARNARFDRSSPQRLAWPVISIGNLSVGGAGKTPLVICLAKLLAAAELHPDVLSRGYGRSGQTAELVDPSGNADRFGDEPLLIARSAAVPVYVGAVRYEAGLIAEKGSKHRGVHLLDDGFQHRQLARNLDIVVIHRSDLTQRLLPTGRLREPLSSLKRAGVIVLREEDEDLEAILRRYTRRECHFWRVRRGLSLPIPVQRAVAFCGIARPQEFFAGLQALGAGLAEQVRFRDHHRYTAADIDRLVQLGKRHGCDGFVTTAKDSIKLDAARRARLGAVAPLAIAELSVELLDPVAALTHMRESLIVLEP
jgi:tetraacyldisaccharide 4'-kinase